MGIVRCVGEKVGNLNKLARLFHPKSSAALPKVVASTESIAVLRDGIVLGTESWSDIKKIIAYKRDLWTYDTVCVGFMRSSTADSWLEICEDWEGFEKATAIMERLYPTIVEGWLGRVMNPAFKTNETVLWEGS